MVSGLKQVVLALLTLSSDGCRSLLRHNMAAERGTEEETYKDKGRRGVRRKTCEYNGNKGRVGGRGQKMQIKTDFSKVNRDRVKERERYGRDKGENKKGHQMVQNI